MAIWQCCKCGTHNVHCSNLLCSHYHCEGCPNSYTNLLHSDGFDQSTPVASAQTGLRMPLALAHPTQAIQQPQPNGNANIYPVTTNALDTFSLQNLTSYAPAQSQPQGSHYVQNYLPSVQPQPFSMFMPNLSTAITAPQTIGAPVQVTSQTQMDYQATGGFTAQGQTQAPYIPSYTSTGYPHVLSSHVEQPTATGVYSQNNVPGFLPQVLAPSQQNTPRPVQQPTANAGYNLIPTGTMAPPPVPARQTNNQMNTSGPTMLRGTRASMRPHPYRRESPAPAFNGQRVNSVPRPLNASATPLRAVSTAPRFVDPIPRVSVFTHPVYGMDILNSGVNEEQVLRNQAEGIQRLTGVQTPPERTEEEIRSRLAQMVAEEIRRQGLQVMPEEIHSSVPQMMSEEVHEAPSQMIAEQIQGGDPQTMPEEIQGGDPQTMPEEIQERDPYMMADASPIVLPEGLYQEARAMLGIPEPVTARLAPMQVQPASSQPIQETRRVNWQGFLSRLLPMSVTGIFLSGLDPERLFRGTGITVAGPGEVPTITFLPTGLGGQMQEVTAGMEGVQLGGGTGEEEEDDEDDEDDSEDEESEEEEGEEEDEEDEDEEDDEEDEDEDEEDGGAPLSAPFYQGEM